MLGELEITVHIRDFDCYYVTEKSRGFFDEDAEHNKEEVLVQVRYEARMAALIKALPDLLSLANDLDGFVVQTVPPPYDALEDLCKKAREILDRLT